MEYPIIEAVPSRANFRIRKYSDADLGRFQELWGEEQEEGRSSDRSALSFQRLIRYNPFSSSHDDYLVLEEGGSLIAYEGVMPFRFSMSGQAVNGCIYHDTMVSQERRGQGLGTVLVRSAMERHPGFSIAVWMNAPNGRVFSKCGWKPVEGIYTYARIYTVNSFFKTRYAWLNDIAAQWINRLISTVYACERAMRRLLAKTFRESTCGRKHTVHYVDSFDDRIDVLFHSVRDRFPFVAFRTSEVLNWKYSNDASREYRKLILLEGDEVTGYMIFRTRQAENKKTLATIFDFLCSPDDLDVFGTLLQKAIADMEESKPDTIEILCSSSSFAGALKKRLFLKARDNPHALKYFHSEAGHHYQGIEKGKNWFFTFGDGDKTFWGS